MGKVHTRLAKAWRALLLRQKGERARALELARASLLEARAVLAQRPDDIRALQQASLSLAVLGERQAAWDAYERRRTWLAKPDALDISDIANFRLYLYAALGDRDGALRTLEVEMKRRNPFEADQEYTDLYLFFVRGDPRIQALLKDPASNAPLPIVNLDLQKMLAELQAPIE